MERLSEQIKSRLEQLLLVLIVAVVFSFLIGILASTIVNILIGLPLTELIVYTIILVTLVLVGIVCIVFYYYAFLPNTKIIKKVIVPIVYNKNKGKIIDDPFDGYYPQKMAWQAFERIVKKNPEYQNRLKKSIPLKVKEKHILTELLEYLFVLTLGHELRGFWEKRLAPDKKLELPKGLKENTFISFFEKLEPKDIIDRSMSQLNIELPADFSLEFISPTPPKHRMTDPNTFQIKLNGKCCDIKFNVYCTSLLRISSMKCGPSPSFEGVRIRSYFQRELAKQLGSLWRATFRMEIEAKFKVIPLLFSKFLRYDPYAYMDWIENWMSRIMSGDPFRGFDFEQIREINKLRREDEIYEIVKSIQIDLDDISKSLRR